MPEHFSKHVTEATCWCKKCNAMTQHRIDPPLRGPCLVCLAKLERANEVERIRRRLTEEEEAERKRRNPTLFD